MLDLKKEARNLFLGILFIIGLLWVINRFNIHIKWVFLFALLFSLGTMIYSKNFTFKGYLIKVLCISFVFGIVWFLEPLLGVWGYIATGVLIGVFIIIMRRKKWLQVKHHIETMIWGKPIKDLKKEEL